MSHHPCAAFSWEMLLNSRWLPDGCNKLGEGVWHDLLVTNNFKQHIFLQRILFVFELTKRKAGKAQLLRLSQEAWDHECDIACLMGATIEEMRKFRDPSNALCFSTEKIKEIINHYIEGKLG